eukprot:scaffold97082_cov21-Prasinocladus_malaysianus.AAC.2
MPQVGIKLLAAFVKDSDVLHIEYTIHLCGHAYGDRVERLAAVIASTHQELNPDHRGPRPAALMDLAAKHSSRISRTLAKP